MSVFYLFFKDYLSYYILISTSIKFRIEITILEGNNENV